jgi:hypothetical protein
MKTYNHIKTGVLFSVLLSLFCFSCNNFFQPPKPEKATAGKGSVALSIGGVQVGRTILPKTTADDFKSYRLVFTSVGGVEITVDVTSANLTQPILLDAGKYSLTVTAYMESDCNKPAAYASLDINIIFNTTTTIPVTLKANIDEEGTGTFSWDITYPDDVTTASMTITRFTEDGEEVVYDVFALKKSIELDAGYYRVVIKLSKSGGEETAELREILHIYPNMESGVFNPAITNSHFTRAIYVTNEDDSGTGSLRWAIEQAKLRANSTIIIDSSVKTITLSSSLEIPTTYSPDSPISLTIEGNGVTITQNSPTGFYLLFVGEAHIITIRRVHFKGGKSFGFEGSGGAISSGATLTLESCIFSENQAVWCGGALNNFGTMDIKGCTFYGNSVVSDGWGGNGGAIINNYGSSLSLTGNLFYGNTAPSYPVINDGISGGYNVVDVQLGDTSDQSGWTSGTGDQYIPGPTVMPKTFKPISGTGATNVFPDALPADYPTIDFYGNPITLATAGAAAGAVQEEADACIVTFDTSYPRIKISPVAVEQGETIEKPGDPERYDNEFLGWYTEGRKWNFGTDKAPNVPALTLNAKWKNDPPTFSNLAEQLTAFLTNAQDGGTNTITINVEDGYIAPLELTSDVPVTITLTSENPTDIKTISLGEKGSMFNVGNNVTLILENITLRGHSYNTAPLVRVGGELIMENGSTITGNTNTRDGGGGVIVGALSTFTMNGGTISGNEAYYGGGVYLGGSSDGWTSTFEMSGNARISGNIANSGGGVYVSFSGLFDMKGGTISGNEATSDGVDEGGGGVYFKSGLSDFYMRNGTVYGNENEIEESLRNTAKDGAAVFGSSDRTTNDTIKKVNGIRTFDVKSERQWIAARTEIISGGSGYTDSIKDYVINVVDSFAVAGSTTSTFGDVTYIKVTITGNDKIISLKNTTNGNLLRIGARQEVTTQKLKLFGKGIGSTDEPNNTSLVYIYGGTLNMNGGKISNNKNNSSSGDDRFSSGGGVYVDNNGANIGQFTMSNNATISDNTITVSGGSSTNTGYGGGVHVGNNSKFIMNDNTYISDNTITVSGDCNWNTGNGGGVFVNGGTVIMGNAVISGNTITVSGSPNSNNGSGGGVYMQLGTFTMNDGTISGNIININDGLYDSKGKGGGIYMQGGGSLTMTGESSISNNTININGGTCNGSGGGVSLYGNETFTMSDNATISYNTINMNEGSSGNGLGGGVCLELEPDRKVTMNSGIIDHNEINIYGSGSGGGGGVYLTGTNATNLGTFNMKGGEIKRNSVTADNNPFGNGGGVYVNNYGKFQIENGRVHGEGSDKNTAKTGAALFVDTSGTAEYGTFVGDLFSPTGGEPQDPVLTTRDETFWVEDGNLEP